MARYYYSSQPFLAWCFNHYFYGGVHFAWVGAPFYPYRLPNPTSSNPFRIYQDLYEPWKDRDRFSRTIAQMRLDVRKGVIAGTNPRSLKRRRLFRLCDDISQVFFYPIVYRVDVDLIAPVRLELGGSGEEVGSQEFKIVDLHEGQPNEFDILFADFQVEGVPSYMLDLWNGGFTERQALELLETKGLV